MIEKVLNYIDEYKLVDKGESIIVGLSGGPDSVCLVHILSRVKEALDIKIYPVHINHMLRGQESNEDQNYVIKLCRSLDLEIYIYSSDIKKIASDRGISLEEAGREERYRIFNHVANSCAGGKIAVAHNKNDQAETVLLNIIRGSGLDGLNGMEPKRGNIIRPLLEVERWEIEAYCRDNRLNPRIDSSNHCNIYTRNKIRIDLIPHIDKLFDTDIVHSINKMLMVVKDDIHFMHEDTDKIYGELCINSHFNKVELDLYKLGKCHVSQIRRVIRKAISVVKGDLKGIESVHIKDIIDLIKDGRTGAFICLPKKIRAQRSYTTLNIFIENPIREKIEKYKKQLDIFSATYVEGLGVFESIIETWSENQYARHINAGDKNIIQYFDFDKFKEKIYVRTRENGDVFKPLNSNGTKKLKEFFIDTKVPREDRDNIPLLAVNGEIVWIIGHKISDKFKVTENTKRVLKISFKKL